MPIAGLFEGDIEVFNVDGWTNCRIFEPIIFSKGQRQTDVLDRTRLCHGAERSKDDDGKGCCRTRKQVPGRPENRRNDGWNDGRIQAVLRRQPRNHGKGNPWGIAIKAPVTPAIKSACRVAPRPFFATAKPAGAATNGLGKHRGNVVNVPFHCSRHGTIRTAIEMDSGESLKHAQAKTDMKCPRSISDIVSNSALR